MDEGMRFPDTVEEFMKQYKVVDREGIYMSKGSELVPIFRMDQWFEHEKAKLSQEATTKGTTCDLISRQAAIRWVKTECNPYGKPTLDFESGKRVMKHLEQMSPAQPHLITEIQNGIKATDAKDVYSCGMRNGMRWCMSLIDGKEPLYENCPSAQPEERTETHAETHARDLISRQAAIDVLNTGFWGVEWDKALATAMLNDLPPAQPETAKRIVGKSRDGMTLWYQCDMCNEPVDAQDHFCRGCGRRLIDE